MASILENTIHIFVVHMKHLTFKDRHYLRIKGKNKYST